MNGNGAANNPELEAALRGWVNQGQDSPFTGSHARSIAPLLTEPTELSATVFSAEPHSWIRYLTCSPESRYEAGIGVQVYFQAEPRIVAFEAESDNSEWLAELLRQALAQTRQRLANKPHVLTALNELLFASAGKGQRVRVRLSPSVPSSGTREVAHPELEPEAEVRIVLNAGLVHRVREALQVGSSLNAEQRLGLCWPAISRFISQLAYPTSPRDRFVAKIDVFAKMTFVALNVLYEGRKSGQLLPCYVGSVFEEMASRTSGIPRSKLHDEHRYFRLLTKLGFLLRDNSYSTCEDIARIAAREFLDESYLRLSLSGAMPETPFAMRAMAFERKRDKIRTPSAVLGRYGIVDEEDLQAWKKVEAPFRDLGFVLLRQTGMGDFGRVYEAVNQHNPQFPEHVALKVDRIIGKKKEAILEAEAAMVVGRDLARAPHLVRLYDTGKLHRERFTYHVLQLIEGETLDNLIGVIGQEHASVSRPPQSRASLREVQEEYRRAMSAKPAAAQRQRRSALPFRYALSPAMVLDLLTSVLLTIEEVHQTGYAINDLKNDNLMMNRRGQVKGIDLDSYSPVHSPLDKVTDFMFLAASLILILFNAPVSRRRRDLPWIELTESEERLRAELDSSWPFGDVAATSSGRVARGELMDLVVDLVRRSRQLTYCKNPEIFSADIVRLIAIKRRLLVEDLVID